RPPQPHHRSLHDPLPISFSPWDTFRSLHPLLCIIAPQRQNDMIISMLGIYRQTGQLPLDPMTGFHSIPIIVDSYLKGITRFDKRSEEHTSELQSRENLVS